MMMITLSPLTNNFEMNRSLFTGLPFFLPLADLGVSVHICAELVGVNFRCEVNCLGLTSLAYMVVV